MSEGYASWFTCIALKAFFSQYFRGLLLVFLASLPGIAVRCNMRWWKSIVLAFTVESLYLLSFASAQLDI